MKVRAWGEAVAETRDYLRKDTVRIRTGFASIDTRLRGGLRPGHVAMLIGRTGVGKSALSLQMAVNQARSEHTVCVASLEMTRQECVVRALSAATGKSLDQVETGLSTLDDLEKFAKLKDLLPGLVIDDTPKPGWTELEEWLEEVTKSLQCEPSVVVLDHLKLLKRYGYPRGEVERVHQLAEDAKKFAKETNTALVVIHQVGRGAEVVGDARNHGHLPLSMESAMYGGEQDSDVMFGVYRPEMNPALSPGDRSAWKGVMFLQLLKNRHGEANQYGVPLRWQLPSMTITESDDDPRDYLGGEEGEKD